MGEASKLCQYSSKQTLSAREIQTAVQLVLPGELGKHSISEGGKAVNKYHASLHPYIPKDSRKGNGSSSRKNQSQSSRAGLKFPVSIIAKMLKEGQYSGLLGGGAPI